MISTALDNIPTPPSSKLLGWHVLDARPKEGWIRIGFDGKPDFCNPAGFVQGGILSAMLDDTMGPAVFTMTDGKLYTATITMTVNFLSPAKPGPITGEAEGHPARQDRCLCGRAVDGRRWHAAGDRHDQRAAGRDGEGDRPVG